MTRTKKNALFIVLSVLLLLAAGIVLLSNQFLIARVLEVREDCLLVEVSNTPEYRWIDRKLGGAGDFEYLRLYTEDPRKLRRGEFFAAVTEPGTESSEPPGVRALWIFR